MSQEGNPALGHRLGDVTLSMFPPNHVSSLKLNQHQPTSHDAAKENITAMCEVLENKTSNKFFLCTEGKEKKRQLPTSTSLTRTKKTPSSITK